MRRSMVPALGHLRPGPMIPSADLVRVQVQEQQAVQVGVGVSGGQAAAAVELNRKSKAEDSGGSVRLGRGTTPLWEVW